MEASEDIRSRCLEALRGQAGRVPSLSAFVGLDGFVDEIIHVVDKREDARTYGRIPTLYRLGDRIAQAAGRSTNIELVTQRVKLGGNGPILANALARLDVGVCYAGAVGWPRLHPVFAPLAERGEVFPLAEAAHTDALEFEDGKLMLGKMTPLADLTWEAILERMGREAFRDRIRSARLVSFVNWTMVPHMSSIWRAILEEGMLQSSGQSAFFDLCDPEKRSDGDIREAMELLGGFRRHCRVILGLNEKEAIELAEAHGIPVGAAVPEERCALAEALFRALDVDMLVVHPVAYALAVSREATAWTPGPFVERPLLTTGAGDHFNAGFCLGELLGLGPDLSLQLGVTCSGYYVRSGRSPGREDLIGMLEDWPRPA